MQISDYWKKIETVPEYKIKDENWILIPFNDFYRKRAAVVLMEDNLRKDQDRAELSYLSFLDRYTDRFLNLLDLPKRQSMLFDAIVKVNIEKGIKNKINLENAWIGNLNFYEKLKQIINDFSFEWVNQSDIAQLFEINQWDVSQHFKALCTKWLIKESWLNGKKKLYIISDMDIVWFSIMRYYVS